MSSRDLDRGTAAAPRLPRPISAIGERLPQFPHSVALAIGLNLALRPMLSEHAAGLLQGRAVAIRVEDAGVEFRVRLGARGFVPLRGAIAPEVVIAASAYDFYLMARRLEDPDTLFFHRRLRIEGDTELGLALKNALDALDLEGLPRPLRALLEGADSLFAAVRGRWLPR